MSEPKTRTLGALLSGNFELLDPYGPLEMFGSIGAGLRIATVVPSATRARAKWI